MCFVLSLAFIADAVVATKNTKHLNDPTSLSVFDDIIVIDDFLWAVDRGAIDFYSIKYFLQLTVRRFSVKLLIALFVRTN